MRAITGRFLVIGILSLAGSPSFGQAVEAIWRNDFTDLEVIP